MADSPEEHHDLLEKYIMEIRKLYDDSAALEPGGIQPFINALISVAGELVVEGAPVEMRETIADDLSLIIYASIMGVAPNEQG